MRILPQQSFALAVDLQTRLMPAIQDGGAVLSRSALLLRGLWALSVPALITEQYPKGIGPTCPELLAASPGAPVLQKECFGCLDCPEIARAARALGRNTALVFGVEAHVCVLQTVIGLSQAGYRPVLVADCIGSRRESDRAVALERARQEGALLTTSEALLFELTAGRQNPAFRTILELIK